MGDEEDRRAGLLPDAQQLLVELVAGDLVERAERLVHQQDARPADQRPGDRHALAHAAGKLVRQRVLAAREADQLEQSLRIVEVGAARRRPARPPAAARHSRSRVRQGSSVASWKTKAKSRSRRACFGRLPSTVTRPRVGVTRSATARSSVDLPQPEGPSMVTMLPSGMSTETRSSAVTASGAVAEADGQVVDGDRGCPAAAPRLPDIGCGFGECRCMLSRPPCGSSSVMFEDRRAS